MKYIKIILKGKKEPIYLPIDKWESILNDEKNLVAYRLEDERDWTGRVLNKLDVSWAEYDREYSDKKNERPYQLYRRISTNTVLKVFEGELPDDINDYEKI